MLSGAYDFSPSFALGGMGHTVAASPWTDSTLKVNYLKAEEGPATEVRHGISTTLTLPPPTMVSLERVTTSCPT